MIKEPEHIHFPKNTKAVSSKDSPWWQTATSNKVKLSGVAVPHTELLLVLSHMLLCFYYVNPSSNHMQHANL